MRLSEGNALQSVAAFPANDQVQLRSNFERFFFCIYYFNRSFFHLHFMEAKLVIYVR
jgi:hypothetical protein